MLEDQLINQSSEPTLTTHEPGVVSYLTYVGINQAARLVGKGKTQIYNDIKAGRLSWHIENDKKLLRVSDLDRVYKLKVKTDGKTGSQNQDVPPLTASQTTSIPPEMAIELAVLKEALRRADEEIQDLRQKQDKQLETINRLTLLLPAPSAPPSAPLVVNEPERRPDPSKRQPFWKRLFS